MARIQYVVMIHLIEQVRLVERVQQCVNSRVLVVLASVQQALENAFIVELSSGIICVKDMNRL